MQLIPYRGGPLDKQTRTVVAHIPARVPVTAREGGGWSLVDAYYEYEDGVLVWRGPER